jgi:hypothetical protein
MARSLNLAWSASPRLGLLALGLLAHGAPCRSQEPAPAPVPASAPVAAATPAPRPVGSVRPALRLRPSHSLGLQLRNTEGSGSERGVEGATLPATRGDRMKSAFAAELRREAIESRRAALYATIPTELPELLEDDWIRRQQQRVAESVIGDAVEAAVSEGFFGGRHHQSKVSIRPMVAAAQHGLKVDASPSWSYRIRAPRGGFSVDVPLTPSSIRLHAYKDLHGTDRREMRLGAGLLLDPFDEEIRAGISLQF